MFIDLMAKKTRIFILRRVAKVQQDAWEHKQRGATFAWIYRNVIKDRYDISQSTFNRYMGMRIKGELERLEREEMKE